MRVARTTESVDLSYRALAVAVSWAAGSALVRLAPVRFAFKPTQPCRHIQVADSDFMQTTTCITVTRSLDPFFGPGCIEKAQVEFGSGSSRTVHHEPIGPSNSCSQQNSIASPADQVSKLLSHWRLAPWSLSDFCFVAIPVDFVHC